MEKAKAAKVSNVGVVPNPKARLLDRVREVIQVKHRSIRTEAAKRFMCEWRWRGERRGVGMLRVRPVPVAAEDAVKRARFRQDRTGRYSIEEVDFQLASSVTQYRGAS
jgi:hypothetical protein